MKEYYIVENDHNENIELWVKWTEKEEVVMTGCLFTEGDLDPVTYRVYTKACLIDIMNRGNNLMVEKHE